MSVFTVTLPPNATYKHRTATLVRLRLDPLFGVLEIRESRTPDGAAKTSRYAVRENPLPDSDDRRFKLTKPGGEFYHHAVLSPRGDACECEAFLAGRHCKHLMALRGLFLAGHLDTQPKEMTCFRS